MNSPIETPLKWGVMAGAMASGPYMAAQYHGSTSSQITVLVVWAIFVWIFFGTLWRRAFKADEVYWAAIYGEVATPVAAKPVEPELNIPTLAKKLKKQLRGRAHKSRRAIITQLVQHAKDAQTRVRQIDRDLGSIGETPATELSVAPRSESLATELEQESRADIARLQARRTALTQTLSDSANILSHLRTNIALAKQTGDWLNVDTRLHEAAQTFEALAIEALDPIARELDRIERPGHHALLARLMRKKQK